MVIVSPLVYIQLAATMKEWDIPFEDLNVGDAIGKGRIGTVYR